MPAKLQDRNFANFNQQDYDFKIELDNGEKKITLNAQAIKELSLTESFLNWYTEGHIVINNAYDHLERLGNFKDNQPLANAPELDYKYRGDGRDIIRITIKPRIDSVAGDDLAPIELENNIWEIYMEGIIYDVEEPTGNTAESKIKKLYFWEKEYHMMLEKNIEFTTANVGENLGQENIHNLSNEERSLKSGEALLELLKSVEELKEKVPESVESETWTAGDEKNTIMYTSPANYKVIDDVNEILNIHTDTKDNDYDLCFLKFNRRLTENDKKQFSFEALSSYFEKAGTTTAKEYQLEMFVLMDLGETSNVSIPVEKVPKAGRNINRNIQALTRNEIESYQFVEMSGLDSADLLAIFPVHNFEKTGSQFNIHIKDHTPENAKKFQDTQYVKKIGPKSTTRMQLNNWKKDGYNLHNVKGDGSKEARYAFGRNKILSACLLNGSAISFNARGQTSRQAGRFFSIRKDKFNDTDFDDRLEGQYLTMAVSHNFDVENQNYTNSMVGVKLHRYGTSKGNIPEDDTELLS